MSDESLFREVDEEVRQDQLKKIWDRYGNAIIGLCLVVVIGVAGFKGWQYWQVKQSEAAGQVFFDAARLADAGKADEAVKLYSTIGHAGYGQLARLREAAVFAASGNSDAAVKAYDGVAADASADPAIRDLARIRAGYVLAETARPDDLKARIGSFDVGGGPWRHAAREIIGIAAYHSGDYATADRYMSAILADPETPAGLRQRARTLGDLLVPLLAKS
ncbi:MAG: tetratricopeptide repeat protein [Rhizobiales bacterium]|nr:tetratricopeptide repeat protein [Hyphomicrobiales bacterium]MBI3674107.1 tetratricopeptide repeat protein [Hyphomicrobiales bacterium]